MPQLAFWLALMFCLSEAVHLHVMQLLVKNRPDHDSEVSDRANFALVNDISGFVPLALIALGSAVCGGIPSIKPSFWLYILVAGTLQAIGINAVTQAVKLGKLTWLLALDSVSPVIQAGAASTFQHQRLTKLERIGIGLIALGMVTRFKLPQTNKAAVNNSPSDIHGWRQRTLRYIKGSLTILYLATNLVWIPYTPVIQEACYSMHQGWATPAFVMSLVFLVGAVLSFAWNVTVRKRHFAKQGDQVRLGTLSRSVGISSWRYFVRSRRVFALNAVILTFQQFAELTALMHAHAATVTAATKLTVVFFAVIRLVGRMRGKEYPDDDDGLLEWIAIGLLIAGAIVMVR